MAKVLNIGSINLDHVYRVAHFVRPGETLACDLYERFAGGKGFNQSVALARAGAMVQHAGCIGHDGEGLRADLSREGVDVTAVRRADAPTGHAMIQVTPEGENAIVVNGGANRLLTPDAIRETLSACAPDTCLLLQNETSAVAAALTEGRRRGLRVVFNPAPMTPAVCNYPLEHVDVFMLNETEARALTGEANPDDVCRVMRKRFPRAQTVLTLGGHGAWWSAAGKVHKQTAHRVEVVDTTAAGDTFVGYFLETWLRHGGPVRALARGCLAAALCVGRAGASASIPYRHEVDAFEALQGNGATRA